MPRFATTDENYGKVRLLRETSRMCWRVGPTVGRSPSMPTSHTGAGGLGHDGRFTCWLKPYSTEVAGVHPDAARDPHAGRNLDQYRALRDD